MASHKKMANWKFKKYHRRQFNECVYVYNNGKMYRDFTYINDISDEITSSIKFTLNSDCHEIINLGSDSPIKLINFVTMLENILQKDKNFLLKPLGHALNAYADTSKAKQFLNFEPMTKIEEGLRLSCDWYASYSS